MLKIISLILAIFQFCLMPLNFALGRHDILIDRATTYQTFESFGTSSCWWAQTIESDEQAREIARLLYDDKDGLGLDVFS